MNHYMSPMLGIYMMRIPNQLTLILYFINILSIYKSPLLSLVYSSPLILQLTLSSMLSLDSVLC